MGKQKFKPPRIDEEGKSKCRAHSSRTGKPCKKDPMLGSGVCKNHGGRAPQVMARAEQRVRDMLAEAIDPDRAMREAALIAYSDLRDLFNEDGSLKPPKDWPDHLAGAISSVEVLKKNVTTGDGKMDDIHKIRLWDKTRALEFLLKHHGKLKESVEHTGALEISWKSSE